MAGRGIVIKIEGDGESARIALQMVREEMAKTSAAGSEAADSLSSSMERIKHSLEYVGIYMGIREAIAGIKEMIGGSVELGVELGHLSQQTGISTQNLSVMKFMSEETGVSFESLTKGLKKFSVEILGAEEGKKQSIASFARLGISQQQVKKNGDDMLGMLGMVADRFKTMPDGPLKTAEAVSLFGRSGMELIPILNQGASGIASYAAEAKALGLVLDESGIAKMEALHAATVRLEGAMKGAELGITSGMSPALTSLADALGDATGKGEGFEGEGKKIGEVMLGTAHAVAYLVNFVKQAAYEFDALASEVNKAAHATGMNFDIGSGARAKQRAEYDADVEQIKQDIEDAKAAQTSYDAFVSGLNKSTASQGDDRVGTNPHVVMVDGKLVIQRDKPKTPTTDLALQPGGSGGKVKSDDGFIEAQARLQEEQASVLAASRKIADQIQLAELEAQHKELLVSDEQFYAEKLRLQNDEIDAEATGHEAKKAALETKLSQQLGDKTLKRDPKTNQSAEQLRTQQQILAVQQQIDELEAKRAQNSSSNMADMVKSSQQAELAGLKVAAELEKEKNKSIAAQIALIQKEHEMEAQKSTAAGGSAADAANIRALGEIAVKKLQIERINQQIADSTNDNKRAVEELNDAAAKDPRFKKAATQQINQLNKQEAQTLRDLVAQYTALAQELGGPFLQKAKDLQVELDKLSRPNQKADAQWAKTVGDQVSSMAERMASATMSGKDSFHKMAQSIEKDVLDLAIKLATEKWLTPLLTGIGGGAGGGGDVPSAGIDMFNSLEAHADGGTMNGPSVVGERGPEIWSPPAKGGTVTPHEVLQKIADGGGGRGGMNITTNVVNQTSQPVTAAPASAHYNSDLDEYIVHVVLKDAAKGGPTSALMGGG